LKLFNFGNKLISVLYYMLNPAVKVLKSIYSFVIKLIVEAGIFPFQSYQNIG